MRPVRNDRLTSGRLRSARNLGLAAACIACSFAASAVDETGRVNVWGIAEADQAQAQAQTQTQTQATPRLVRGVALQQSQWRDGAAAPANASAATLQATDVSYRWGVGTGRSAVDVGLGAGAYRVRQGGQGADAAPPPAGADGRQDIVVPTVSVGLRHSLSDQQHLSVYAGGSASLASSSVGEFYTTKVKVEWLPTKHSSIGFEHAAVNMRFGPTSNFALRVRRGGPMIYYRSTF